MTRTRTCLENSWSCLVHVGTDIDSHSGSLWNDSQQLVVGESRMDWDLLRNRKRFISFSYATTTGAVNVRNAAANQMPIQDSAYAPLTQDAEVLANVACKKWNQLLPLGVFTQQHRQDQRICMHVCAQMCFRALCEMGIRAKMQTKRSFALLKNIQLPQLKPRVEFCGVWACCHLWRNHHLLLLRWILKFR